MCQAHGRVLLMHDSLNLPNNAVRKELLAHLVDEDTGSKRLHMW